MNRIAIILPYFGKLPDYFGLFLNSCKENPTIDWYLFTDDRRTYEFPSNVYVEYMSFSDLKSFFQEKFDFDICLNTPYKLCDYRPAYGYIFSDLIKDYDFWGYCDLDLLWGNIRKFLPDGEIIKYDKVGHLGHLALYQNAQEVNTIFMAEIEGRRRYKEVFSCEGSCVFDEWGEWSINRILLHLKKKLWIWNDFFDVYAYDENLTRVVFSFGKNGTVDYLPERKIKYIVWEKGSIRAYERSSTDWDSEEYAYAHFQKRKMKMQCRPDDEHVLCMPNRFILLSDDPWKEHQVEWMLRRVFNWKKWKHNLTVAQWVVVGWAISLRDYLKTMIATR